MQKYYQQSFWNVMSHHRWPVFPFCREKVQIEGVRIFNETPADYLICVAITAGEITYQIGGRNQVLSAGMVFLIPPNTRYAFRSSQGYGKDVLEIKGIHLSSLLVTLGLDQPVLLPLGHCEEILAIFDEIDHLMKRRERQDIPLLMGKTYELLHLCSLLATPDSSPDELQTEKALRLLESSLHLVISIPEIAQQLSLSERSLERLVQKSVQLTPQQYRNRCRLEHAEYLLIGTELSIKEIAFQLGYCNPCYFSAEFRRYTTLSPQNYRKMKFIESNTTLAP